MATLYDAHGNVVDATQLKKELAAPKLTSVRQVISDHPSAGLTPERLGRLLRDSEYGDARSYLELAEDMEDKYIHYAAQLRTRKLACMGLEVVVKAAGEGAEHQDAADLVTETIENLDMPGVIMDALDGIGKGYSVLEILWDTTGQYWLPTEIVWRDPRWFRYDIEDGATLLLLDGGLGVPLAPFKFIYHRPKIKSGIPIRGGLARAAAWAYLFSNVALKDWVGFCEVYGQPIRVGKYPPGKSEDEKSVLRRALHDIGADCSAIIPEGMLIEFVETATKTATGELYDKLIRYLDERVTIAVLGQTLTSGQTQGGGGSFALGQVHEGVRYDLLEADARQLSATLTQQLAKPLVDLNLGPRDVYPRIELFVKKSSDLTALADQLTKLVPLGLKVDAREVRDKWGFSEPEEGAEILTAPQMPSQFGGEFPGMPGMGNPGADTDDGEPEPISQAAPVEPGAESVQDTALNGAQTASLLQILDSVVSGRLPKSAAKEVIKVSFPMMPHDRIDGMVDPIEVKPAGGENGGGFESEHSAQKPKPQKKEYAEVVSDQLEIATADAMEGMLEPVMRLVAGAHSYQEIIDGVAGMFPEMDDESYAETVAGALVAANLAGASTIRRRRNG